MDIAFKKVEEKVRELAASDMPAFMFIEVDSRGKEKIKISPAALLDFCKEEGFCSFRGRVIHLMDGLAEFMEPSDVYQHCLAYVQEFVDKALESLFITSGESLLIGRKGVLLGLPECPQEPIRDNATTAYYFYQNGIVKVERGHGVEVLPFGAVPGFIWKDSIKDRQFTPLEDEEIERGQFYRFVENTINNQEHAWSNWAGLGYAIHGYKDPTLTKAIIINDENLEDNGKPEGGTGKGLYVKAIQNIVPVAIYNGKNSDFGNNRFAYQSVTPATRILFIDDLDKNFPFETLFSVLTDDMVIERKHKAPEVQTYKDSPKFILTTNYTIRGTSSSFKRRRCDIFLNGYYGAQHRPVDDFGCEFFHGWDAAEWNRFDNFMMACVLQFLEFGLVEYQSKELEVKMLKHETSREFWEVMERDFSKTGARYHQWKIKEQVHKAHPGRWVSNNIDHVLAEWIKIYADHKGYEVKKGNTVGTWYEFAKE